jgi:CRISPR system Cascade subunit CasB
MSTETVAVLPAPARAIGDDEKPWDRFADYLESLFVDDNRAALAALRRGLGKRPGEAAEMHRYVLPQLRRVSPRQEDTYYMVAALFGLYPSRNWRPEADVRSTNLGASLRRFATEGANSEEEGRRNLERVERRFVALLNSRADELPEHLRQVVSLLKTKETPIDWARLTGDLIFWDAGTRRVQRDWSRSFWQGAGEPKARGTATAPAEGAAGAE